MSAIQWNELEVPSPCPSTEKYMKGIPGQKCLCESFGIQVGDGETGGAQLRRTDRVTTIYNHIH